MLSNNLEYLSFAIETAKNAGKILLSYYGHLSKEQVHLKGRRDLVTQADLQSELYIVEQIKKQFPTHGILSEEKTNQQGTEEFRWLIDPLDGTLNFTHGHPYFSISIALEYQKRLEVGVVYAPVLNELFFASRGNGAWYEKTERKQLHVSSVTTLEDALLSTGFYYNRNDTPINNLDNFEKILMLSQGIRRCGSAALELSYIASGRYDGFWELWLQPFDVAAGAILVEEAGGKVTDCAGGNNYIYGHSIIATNGLIHNEIQNNIISFPDK